MNSELIDMAGIQSATHLDRDRAACRDALAPVLDALRREGRSITAIIATLGTLILQSVEQAERH